MINKVSWQKQKYTSMKVQQKFSGWMELSSTLEGLLRYHDGTGLWVDRGGGIHAKTPTLKEFHKMHFVVVIKMIL